MVDELSDATSTVSTEASDACPTPTYSTMSDTPVKSEGQYCLYRDSPQPEYHPRAGESFVIRSRNHPCRIIALQNGRLQVVEDTPIGGGWAWRCTKKSGWYGFCNTVSGTYLGYDGQGKIVANQSHHKSNEYFMVDRRKNGGYVMLTWHGQGLREVAIGKNGTSLEEQEKDGTAWDFIDVDQFSLGNPF